MVRRFLAMLLILGGNLTIPQPGIAGILEFGSFEKCMVQNLDGIPVPNVATLESFAAECREKYPSNREMVLSQALPDCGQTEAAVALSENMTLPVQRHVARQCLSDFARALKFNRSNDVVEPQGLTPLNCELPTYNLVASDYRRSNRGSIGKVIWLFENCQRYNFRVDELAAN